MQLDREHWVLRDQPLDPVAVLGVGSVARALARRVLEREPDGLRAAAGEGILLLVGPTVSLPWAAGAVWLGRDPDAPALLLSTTHRPPVHPALIGRQLGAVALVLEPQLRLPLDRLGPLHLPTLKAWLDAA